MNKPALPASMPLQQRQYLMLLSYVLTQRGYLSRALTLIEGLFALGEDDKELRLARAVLNFLEGRHEATLVDLDWLASSAEMKKTIAATAGADQILRYMRARCYCQTGRKGEGEGLARRFLEVGSRTSS